MTNEALGAYTPDAYVAAVAEVIAAVSPAHVCFPHTYQTRDFAPMLAARLDRALITDVTGVVDGVTAPRCSRVRCSRAS